jgi:hypothetical protein
MNIHVTRDGQDFGPYKVEDINGYLKLGSLLPTDMAWHEGLPSWIPLFQIPGVQVPAKTQVRAPQSIRQANPAISNRPRLATAAQTPRKPPAKHNSRLLAVIILIVGIAAGYFFIFVRNQNEADNASHVNQTFPKLAQRSDLTELVKNGLMKKIDKSTTLGRAFDAYRFFSTTDWKASTDDAGRRIVKAHGVLDFKKLTEADVVATFERLTDERTKLTKKQSAALPRTKKRFQDAIITFQFVVNLDNTFELKSSEVGFADGSSSSRPDRDGNVQKELEAIYENRLPGDFIAELFISAELGF